MAGIVYFQIAGVAGDYFTCDHYRASLAVSRCASMYREAKRDVETSHTACRGCAIGARHAGESAADRPAPIFGRLFCCRCHRPARRLLYRAICISCCNRELEIARGRNAKGRPPTRVPRPHALTLKVVTDAGAKTRAFDRVIDTLEGVYRVLRTEPRQVAFSRARHGPPLPIAQMPLFDALPLTFQCHRRRRYPAQSAPSAFQPALI